MNEGVHRGVQHDDDPRRGRAVKVGRHVVFEPAHNVVVDSG